MITSFDFPTSEKKWIQETIKKYPSLRFEQNPFDTFNRVTQFRISGDVHEMNSFTEDRYFRGLEIGFYKQEEFRTEDVLYRIKKFFEKLIK